MDMCLFIRQPCQAATGLLRCGKSCVVNLYAIRLLRSCGAGRSEAALTTGEKIMISRHYAPALREKLGMRKENLYERIQSVLSVVREN